MYSLMNPLMPSDSISMYTSRRLYVSTNAGARAVADLVLASLMTRVTMLWIRLGGGRGQGWKNMNVLRKGDLKIKRDIPTAGELPIKNTTSVHMILFLILDPFLSLFHINETPHKRSPLSLLFLDHFCLISEGGLNRSIACYVVLVFTKMN